MFIIFLGVIIGLASVVVYAASVASYNNSYRVRSEEMPERPVDKRIVGALLLIPVLLFSILASIAVVGTGEIAVLTRFGRVTGTELHEGIHVKLPIDKANKYDVKVLKKDSEEAAASKDLQDVDATVVVNYRLEAGRVSELHRTVGKSYEEKLINPAISEVFKASTAKFDATELITDRASVKNDTLTLLRERLGAYGVEVTDLSITNFSFSPEFAKAIESKQVEQQRAERARFQARRAEQEAQAEINRAQGQAEAQRLLAVSVNDTVIERLQLDIQKQAIAKWNGQLPRFYGGNSSNLFNIPIR